MAKTRFALGVLLAVYLIFPANTSLANPDVLKWSGVNLPTEGRPGNWVLAKGSDIKELTMAADGTLYGYANPAGTSYTLFKSNDNGAGWTYTGNVRDTIVAIAAAPDDARVIYYATADSVFKSTDAGASFVPLPAKPGGAGSHSIAITSLSVARMGDRYLVAVGTRDSDAAEFGGVLSHNENEFLGNWSSTGLDSYDVYAVAFSPNFATDRGLVAVVSDETNTVVTTMLGSGWGASIGNATISGVTPASADIAFPDDYDVTIEGSALFVAIDTGSNNGDVYRINNLKMPASSIATDLDIGSGDGTNAVDVTSLTVTGMALSAALLAGSGSGGAVFASRDGGTTWTRSAKPPTGTQTWVLMAPDFTSSGKAYAATSGAESAFSYSADGGDAWHQLSLIDTAITSIVDLAPSPGYSQDSTLFLLTGGATYSLWRTLDGGARWERVLSTALPDFDGLDMVGLSPRYGQGSRVVFVAGTSGGGPVSWLSMDGGQTFARPRPSRDPATGADVNINQWAILDDNTLYVGSFDDSHGLVYRASYKGQWYSTGTVAGNNSLYSLALSPDYEKSGTILVGNTIGEVYWSGDSGASFEPLPRNATLAPLTGNISVAFDSDFARNKTVYAGSDTAGKGLYRFVLDQSTGWVSIDGTLPAGGKIGQVTMSTEGVFYAVNTKTDGGIERSLSPQSSSTFETVTSGLDAGFTLKKLWLRDNRLWSIDATNTRLLTYIDTLTVPVSLSSPPDKAAGIDTSTLFLNWEPLPGATSYKWQLSDETDFSDASEGTESGTRAGTAKLPALDLGTTYYWRVKAVAPLLGPWSEKRSFTTRLGSELLTLKLIAPEAGIGKVPVRPVFQWQPVVGAEKYELLVATDVSFVRPVISKVGDSARPDTAWQSDITLDHDTTYYWRVRAMGVNTYSAWSAVGAFTTESPLPSPASPVSLPPPASPVPSAPPSPAPPSVSPASALPQPAVPPQPPPPPPPAPTTIVVTVLPPVTYTLPAASAPSPPQQTTPEWALWLIYLGSGLFLVLLGILVVMVLLTVGVWRRQ